MKRVVWRVLVVAWLGAVMVTWNAVFDSHIAAGSKGYIQRQARYAEGRGSSADMDATMKAAAASGLRSATGYAALVFLPGLAWIVYRRLSRRSVWT